jgi:predicted dienelactone hydrolase
MALSSKNVISVCGGEKRELQDSQFLLPRCRRPASAYPIQLFLRTVLCAALIASAVSCAEQPKRANPVGLAFAAYEDGARLSWNGKHSRPMATAIWYPAIIGTRESEWKVSIFNAGWVAQGAPIMAGHKKLPLVVVSHGTGGSAAALSWLAETLVSNGYIVAAVNHHGNTAAEPSYHPLGFMLWWERATDVSVLIDKLFADPKFGSHIDAFRIGVAGFSLGGYTALATVGARLDYDQWKSFCAGRPADPNCNPPPEFSFSMAEIQRLLDSDDRVKESISHSSDSFLDDRIRAAFAIAPVLGPVMTKASLAEVKVPVRIIVGSKDDQALPDTNVRSIAIAIPNAEFELLPNVAHYTFLAKCNLFGRVVARSLCTDPDEIDRGKVHRTVGADVLKFFNRTLEENLDGNEPGK